MLLGADVVGISVAFLAAELLFGQGAGQLSRIGSWVQPAVFVASLPVWVISAKLFGLYDRDEERTDHSTSDDLIRVFLLVTVGVFLFIRLAMAILASDPALNKLVFFWALAIVLVTGGRVLARVLARRSIAYLQNTIIVGAGEIGQLVARKFLQHPEYGINLVGLIDDEPRERRNDLGHLTLLGGPDRLLELVRAFDVERVVIAFSKNPSAEVLDWIRLLRNLDIQIDVVPRLFEIVGPNVAIHTVEGLPLVGLPPARLSRSSRWLKRSIDIVGAGICLLVTAPLFLVIAARIKRDSPGPVFFRQKRLGLSMQEFEALKFRTMKVGTDENEHRAYIEATLSSQQAPEDTGLFKLERTDAVTKVGCWLRKTSLDELPQLINVLRGDMSLVGPRPCLAYETEHFDPHHFERFLVPAGLTGLWQVTARAHSTFREALEMDVAYARGWSLGLDLRLLCRTPTQVLRQEGTA
jgi:exopolysaccharide biosynthesis polyprenyl glycosylphosphotransferase